MSEVGADTMIGVPESQDAWHREAGEVAAALGSDMRRGLSAAEAAIRLTRFGPNRLEAAQRVPVWRKFLGQFADPLVYLLLVAIAVSLVAWMLEGRDEAPFDAIVIAAIVIANAVLGYVQEARAEQAVAALQRLAAATAGIVRDGREERISAADIVPGDVLVLAEGDAVAADARLVEAASLMVAEASLTGESEPVLKDAAPITKPVGLGDRVNMVFSGTAVVRGRGRAVVTATGMATETGKVSRLLVSTAGAGHAVAAGGRPDRAHARDRGGRDRRRGRRRDRAHLRHPDRIRRRVRIADRRLACCCCGAGGAASGAVRRARTWRAADGQEAGDREEPVPR